MSSRKPQNKNRYLAGYHETKKIVRSQWLECRPLEYDEGNPEEGAFTADVFYLIDLGWPTTWGTREYFFWRKNDETDERK